MAPVFLDTKKTWKKLEYYIEEASHQESKLITWGESLIPGYPVWVSSFDGARWDSKPQKTVYGRYWSEAVELDSPIIKKMAKAAEKHKVTLMGGIAERQGASIYCTLLTIGSDGRLLGRHRKVKPTFYERLIWADGDAEGLRVHKIDEVPVGGLCCWENWMPLARAALHRQGEFIHIAIWPGSLFLVEDVTRFMALEGRSWVMSVSGLLRPQDFEHLEEDFPYKEGLTGRDRDWYNGGSMAVDPKGSVVAGPLVGEEGIIYMDVDPMVCVEERQNLDISGHYSRFDIFNEPLRKKSATDL